MATVTGRLTDYGNAHDFRSVLEDRLNAKRSELGETEQSLKKFVNNRLGSVTQGKADGPDRLPAFRGRLGPVVSARGGRGGSQPAGDRRSSIGSRLGPKISESLDEEDDSLMKGGSNGFGGEVTGRGSVMSRIVVEQKSREDALAEQKVDKKETQRNRRMFGSILGTLQKFRADETKVKDRELKKRQIEAKIDKKTEKEREEAIRQKKELFEDKRRKEREIKVLQVQMKRAEEFETWERSKRKEQKYIRTKNGSIQIYFLPKEHNDATFAALEDTMDEIDKEIQTAKELFEDELLKISERAEQNPNANLDDLEGDDDNSEEDDTDKNVTKSIVSTIKKPHADTFTHKENKDLAQKEKPLRTRSMQENEDISKTLDSIIDNNLNGHSIANGDKTGERETPEYPVITTRDRNVDIKAGKCDQEPEKEIGEKLKKQTDDIEQDVQTTVNETEKASTTSEVEKKVHTTTTNIKDESVKNTEESVSAVIDNASSDKQVGTKLESSNRRSGLHKSRSKSPKGGKASRHRSGSDERRKNSNKVRKDDTEKSLTRKRKFSDTKKETKKTRTRSRKKESSGESSSSSSSSSDDQSESEEKSSASNSSSEDSDSSDASSSSDSPDTKSRKKRSSKTSTKSAKTSISKKRKKESSPSSVQNRRSRKSRTQASRRRKVSNKRSSDSSDSD